MQNRLTQSLLRWFCCGVVALTVFTRPCKADVKLPNIFGDHMVLQQGQKNKIWGLAEAGENVTVKIQRASAAGTDLQSHQTSAGADGKWSVMLDSLSVGSPLILVVAGKNEIRINDVLVGEVWICSGQSNMQWKVDQSNDPDLEKLAAKFPNIRMINYPQTGSQEPIWTHDRQWQVCSPETLGSFSAVGYFFARQLHLTLDVPVGMINNAWGGSACEAWIRKDLLAADAKYKPLLDQWEADEKTLADLTAKENDLTEDHKKLLGGLKGRMGGNHRPANIYNGVLKSHLGYGIKGAIWYQGESNASRAYQYRDLFPLMIDSWRKEWGQGNFPFYWVQLADFMAEKT